MIRCAAQVPSFLEPRRTAGKALVAVIQEACAQSVPTRSVDAPVRAMGGSGVGKSQVSRPCAGIDGRVGAFLARPLEGEWPYPWLDATYVKARRDGHDVPVAAIIAVAVNTDGRREVLGVTVGNSEAEPFWTAGKRRFPAARPRPPWPARGVKLVIPDAHEGLKAAAGRVLGATAQRATARPTARAPARGAGSW